MAPEAAERSGHYRDVLANMESSEQGIRAAINHLYYDLGAYHVAEMIVVTEANERAFQATRKFLRDAIASSGCPAEWCACPEHGNTLATTANRTRCTHPGCDRTWDYDRLRLPCGEPVAYTVTNPDGSAGGELCEGHTIDARIQIPGATFTAIERPDPEPEA